jgi:hypothetical protein
MAVTLRLGVEGEDDRLMVTLPGTIFHVISARQTRVQVWSNLRFKPTKALVSLRLIFSPAHGA